MKLFLLFSLLSFSISVNANNLKIPLIAQSSEYTCGPSALLSVLQYWQVSDEKEIELASEMKTAPGVGTSPVAIIEAAKKRGLEASLNEGMTWSSLKKEVDSGSTVILMIQAWRKDVKEKTLPWDKSWEAGHYVVAVSVLNNKIIMMDPRTHNAYAYIEKEEFLSRWRDYEEVAGKPRHDFINTGIVIKGKNPLKKYPRPIQKLN